MIKKRQLPEKSVIEKKRTLMNLSKEKGQECDHQSGSFSPSSASGLNGRQQSLRDNLLNYRKRLQEASKKSFGELLDSDKYKGISDDAELATLLYHDSIVAAHTTRADERLKAVNAALQRLEENTYGICQECGDEIPAERLRIVPFTAYCTDCQDLMEKAATVRRNREGGGFGL